MSSVAPAQSCWDPRKMSRHVTEATVTPELARYWLGFRNPHNRTTKSGNKAKMVRDMRSGSFGVVPDCIAFDSTGMLINGHNRLESIVEAGVAVQCLVAFGMPTSAVLHTDRGVTRSGADVLAMDGELNGIRNTYAVHALCATLYCWNAGLPYENLPVSDSEIKSIYLSDPERINRIAGESKNLAKLCYAAPSVLGAIWYRCDDISHDQAEDFFSRLGSGVDLPADSPILTLRLRLANARARKERIKRPEQAAWIIKTWNAYRGGRSVNVLRWTPKEGFPELV